MGLVSGLTRVARMLRRRLRRLTSRKPEGHRVRLTRLVDLYRFDPTNAALCNDIALGFRDGLHDPLQAAGWLETSVALEPAPWPLERLGELRRDELNDPRGALEAFARAAELDPTNFWACDRAAEVARDGLKDFVLAERWFRESFTRHPISWPLEQLAVMVRDGVGDVPRAIELCEEACRAEPANPSPRRLMVETAYYRAGDWQRAARCLDECLTRLSCPDLRRRRAFIEAVHGDGLRAAIAVLETARSVADVDEELLFELAILLTDEPDGARRAVSVLEDAWRRFGSRNCAFWLAIINRRGTGDLEAAALWQQRLYDIERSDRQGNPRIPQRRDAQGIARFNVSVDARLPRVLVVSIPKSGTHLVGNLLGALGLVDTDVMVSHHRLLDYRGIPLATRRRYPRVASRPCTFERSLPLIGPGQFAMGHVEGIEPFRSLLSDFKIVFVHRNLRDCMASMLRFRTTHLRHAGFRSLVDGLDPRSSLIRLLEVDGRRNRQMWSEVAAWRGDPRVVELTYEELVGDAGPDRRLETVRRVAQHLSLDLTDDFLREATEAALDKVTATTTGSRSSWRDVWSSQAEAAFERLGLADLNRRLGHEAAGPR